MKPEARSDCEPAGSMVFVVDDDDAMRDSLRSLIRSVGLSVEAFDPYEHPHNKVSGLNVLEFPFREVSPNSLRTFRIPPLGANDRSLAAHHVDRGASPRKKRLGAH